MEVEMEHGYLLDHIMGGLYGQALGDSFAMPSMLRPEVNRERFGWFSGFMNAPDDHPAHHGLKAGQITDDTEQAMSLAQVIIEEGRVSVEGAARAIVQWYDMVDGDHNDYVGPSTRKAVAKLKTGADPHTTGRQGDTDGGAMRISPIGLINPGNLEQAVKDAATSCVPSHNTDVAISGAAAVAGAIAAAIMPGATLDIILEAGCIAAEKGLQYGAPWMGASIPRRIRLAVELANQDKDIYERLVDIYDLIGCGLATSEAVPAAFGVIAAAKGDLMTTAKYAAALSGDADTVAAMACAIVGAWKGFRSFPPSAIEIIERVNAGWNFRMTADGLTEIALLRLAEKQKT
jgi:ADP-ribosylglycohydrolase